MADHGTASLAPAPPAPRVADLAGYRTPIDVTMTYPTPAQLAPLSLPAPRIAIPTSYGVGGTVDNAYHPPVVGQLWPRGDLDAE